MLILRRKVSNREGQALQDFQSFKIRRLFAAMWLRNFAEPEPETVEAYNLSIQLFIRNGEKRANPRDYEI